MSKTNVYTPTHTHVCMDIYIYSIWDIYYNIIILYIYIYIYIYIYMYIHIHIYILIYTYIHPYIHIYTCVLCLLLEDASPCV